MPSVPSTKLRIRQKLGKYRIEKRLGEGGFASVFQAMDTIMGTRVALKIPHEPLVDDQLLASFRKESRLLATVDHPGILQIKDASIINGRLVISFPLGMETLFDRLSRRMSFDTTMLLIDQLMEAVAFAHERKVIHCDIKPENVILFADGSARLADFGIAKVARQTIKGCGTGTVGYMAPEQAMGRPSCRSDVFSLGLVFYRMLAGQWPEWPYEWPLPGYQKLKTRVPQSMIAWLRKSIEINGAKRFPDAVRMRNAFIRIRPEATRFVEKQRAKKRAQRNSDTARQSKVRTRRAA